MSDARDNRHGARRHGAGKAFVVEGHEVLVGAASAHEQDGVGASLLGGMQGAHHKGRSTRALHLYGTKLQANQGVSAAKRTRDVVFHLSVGRGDHDDALAKGGNLRLAGRVHEALGVEPARQAGHTGAQISLACLLELENLKLHAPLCGIDREAARQAHLEAGMEAHLPCHVARAPHHAVHGGGAVGHREVHGLVAGTVLELRDFAFDDERHALKLGFCTPQCLRDAERRRGLLLRLLRCRQLPGHPLPPFPTAARSCRQRP